MPEEKRLRYGVFIDASNMWWAVKRMPEETRWHIDYQRFKDYLQQKYHPVFYRFYTVINEQPRTEQYARTETAKARFHQRLQNVGYSVMTKPLKHIKTEDGSYQTKGDVDVEICLDVLGALDELDAVILCSGDSDYLSLVQKCHAENKYVRIFSFKRQFAWELRKFATRRPRCGYTLMEDIKDDIRRQT